MSRSGRRPGDSGTREAIQRAARARFAEAGFQGATIRGIASDAGVDPALVHHYFGTKRDLFAAALDLPGDPTGRVGDLLDGSGERRVGVDQLLETVLAWWDRPEGRDAIRALLRSGLTDEEAAGRLRTFVEQAILAPLAHLARDDDAQLRAALAGSQLVGLALARYVVGVHPLATADPGRLVEAITPTITRYLEGDLST
jgi:AcrR family transcriptional regulator